MKNLEKGNDKIQEICDILRKDTLEPAKKQAEEIIEQAKLEAAKIKQEAQKEASKVIEEAKKRNEQEKNVFESSLSQAMKQSLEQLRQTIINKVFNKELSKLVEEGSGKIDIVSPLIGAVIDALKKEGLDADIDLYVGKALKPEEVAKALSKEVIEKLKSQTIQVGDFTGGAKLKLENKNLMIDLSDQALKELLASYLKRPEFRDLIFQPVA